MNPLGAKWGKHKVSGFYFVIGNLQPRYRSNLRNIHLLAIVHDKLIKKYSFERVLEPLLKDLHEPQTGGITVQLDGQNKTIFGGLATVSCDNLSALVASAAASAAAAYYVDFAWRCTQKSSTNWKKDVLCNAQRTYTVNNTIYRQLTTVFTMVRWCMA